MALYCSVCRACLQIRVYTGPAHRWSHFTVMTALSDGQDRWHYPFCSEKAGPGRFNDWFVASQERKEIEGIRTHFLRFLVPPSSCVTLQLCSSGIQFNFFFLRGVGGSLVYLWIVAIWHSPDGHRAWEHLCLGRNWICPLVLWLLRISPSPLGFLFSPVYLIPFLGCRAVYFGVSNSWSYGRVWAVQFIPTVLI